MRRICLAAVAVVAWAFSAIAEKAGVDIGMLTCTLGEAVEAPATGAPSEGQMREALCSFKPRRGAEETYAARVQGVSISAEQKSALIWLVRRGSEAAVGPGLLEQTYSLDPKKPAEQKPPLIGEPNSDIALHTLSDKREGSASATEKLAPTGFIILSVELKLKSASG